MRCASLSSPSLSAKSSGANFWFRRVPPVLAWSIFVTDFITAVGPFLSALRTGDTPSETGSFAFLPFLLEFLEYQ